MGRIAVLALALLGQAPVADTHQAGRAIYDQGIGQDIGREPLSATIGTPPWPIAARARACAACHGAAGLGASEGGVAAPSLDLSTLSAQQAVERLAAALRHGRGADGRSLSAAMPRYTIGQADLAALAAYIRRFPFPPQPGLDGSTIAIGLDLAGLDVTPAEQARLRRHVAGGIARINAQGELFGRTLRLADDPAGAFLTISWAGLAGYPGVAVMPRLPGTDECDACCATLHPGLDAQLAWLGDWLAARDVRPTYRGPLAARFPLPAPPRRPDAIVHLGSASDLAPSTGPLYLFADLGAPAAALHDRPKTYLVFPFDIAALLASADELSRSDPALGDAPRVARAAVELDWALDRLVTVLTRVGRRMLRYEACRALGQTVPRTHSFSVLEVSTGAVL